MTFRLPPTMPFPSRAAGARRPRSAFTGPLALNFGGDREPAPVAPGSLRPAATLRRRRRSPQRGDDSKRCRISARPGDGGAGGAAGEDTGGEAVAGSSPETISCTSGRSPLRSRFWPGSARGLPERGDDSPSEAGAAMLRLSIRLVVLSCEPSSESSSDARSSSSSSSTKASASASSADPTMLPSAESMESMESMELRSLMESRSLSAGLSGWAVGAGGAPAGLSPAREIMFSILEMACSSIAASKSASLRRVGEVPCAGMQPISTQPS
mmetsp:Transcript_35937/g.112844  ORF Transcript_35937/g.112844 Transcript_35937/m.112844 type:complete len:269 (+) Transcript_35937:605-1411(+)